MNALILAAGMGTRMRPLTDDRPKCLVSVLGVPIVERQIRLLKEAGIDDIVLLSGYRADRLDYLKGKFGVEIIPNPRYETVNNISSMFVALDRFGDSFVLEGDVYMSEGCFLPRPEVSTYYSVWRDRYKREWGLEIDAAGKLTDVVVGDGTGYIMSGVSYWTKSDAAIIAQRICTLMSGPEGAYKNLFWDNAVLDVRSRLDIRVKEVGCLWELDTPEELRELERGIG